MGYECTYKYHERAEEGGYNREETKTFKKKVGDPFEEVSLEKLAGAVMAQLARRDIWIIDIEVYELSKKQINFKEAKGGIILKNKKFLFDGGDNTSSVIVQDMVQAPAPQVADTLSPNGHVNIQGQAPLNPMTGANLQPHERGQPRRPIDWMVFSPELHMMPEIKQKNLRFTPEKKYPIFEKKESMGGGEVFVMLDDTGREQLVSDKYFVPANVQLFADKELGFSQNQQQRDGGKLYWGGANNEPDMPDVRRR